MSKRKGEETPRGVIRIIDLLDLFLYYNMYGLMVFFDTDVKWLSSDDLFILASSPYEGGDTGVRIQSGNITQYAEARVDAVTSIEKIIKRHGGLDTFRANFTLYEIINPKSAQILKDMSMIGRNNIRNTTAVCTLHHMNSYTLHRRIKHSLYELACLICAQKRNRRRV